MYPSLLCRSERRKHNFSDTQEKDGQQKKRKKFETDLSSNKTEQSKFRSNKRNRHSNDTNSNVRSEGSKKGNKSQFKSFTHGGGKGKVKPQGMEKDKAASNGRIGASKSHKLKRKFNRN
jgi:hypothetical protein